MIPPRDRALWLARHILPHEPALRAWLRRRPVDGLDPDDVVQETYAALAALGRVDHIASPRAYAFQTAQSVVMRHVRRARIVRIDTVDDLERLDIPLEEPSAERQLTARQELRRVTDLIAGLPAKCREAFSLRKIEGLSQRDVAARMGISENTVEKHIGKALRILMATLADDGSEAGVGAQPNGKKGSPDHGSKRGR